jgi:hypothetical protein
MTGRFAAVFSGMLLVAGSAVGCGGGKSDKPPLGRVSGTVTYKGQPLPEGSVTFTPVEGKGDDSGQLASGQIESDGSYSLTTFNTDDGAVLGQHAVTVQSRDGSQFKPPQPGEPIKYVLQKSRIPKKYETVKSTPLRFTVEAGSNEFDIELKD